MKYFKFIFIISIFFSLPITANDVKIIELHKSKTLDQLVLDNKESNKNIKNDLDETVSNSDENNSLKQEVEEEITNEEDNKLDNSIKEINNSDETITLFKTENIFDLDLEVISNHLDTITNIQSKTLHREFIKILSKTQLEDENIYGDKIYFIIKKLYEMGEIKEAYRLVKKINISSIDNNMNLNFFYLIELNYLFSSYRLLEVCELKSFLLENLIILPKYLLEKTDIFCLTLENKYSEARLQNSLLLESEKETDQNFQNLFNYMILNEENENLYKPLSNIKSKELIFLYSAMLRINELPLDKDFIEVDRSNLSIPVILSENTDMQIRIKAANQSYFDEVLSIESLSALYQSVDFNSKQFNDPEKTISSLNSDELIMAYYYQLVNIQIFPNERLNVILKYWNFAKISGLEKIAYAITEKIIETFSLTAENSKFGMEIAFAHIANKKYDEALKWINLYEISNLNDEMLDYARFLINLNQNDDLDTILNYLSYDYKSFDKISNQASLESFDILTNFLSIENLSPQKLSFIDILDDRAMPSYFLMKNIKLNIVEKNYLSVFILSLISMQNKSWVELHPEHLKLILDVINLYDNGSLKKQIILEILNELEIL